MIRTDLHTHTKYSFDGSGTMEQLCRGSIENGMEVIAATEHFDLSPAGGDAHFYRWNQERVAEIKACKERYHGKLNLLAGIELGQPHCNPTCAAQVLQENDFDIVLGSIHNLADGSDVYGIDYVEEKQCQDVIEAYLGEVYRMALVSDFDVLGHIDFPIRNMGKVFSTYDMKPYEEQVREILKVLSRREKALEVNTRGMRCWQKCICPQDWILTAFRQYGGKYLAVGSDSHTAEFVGIGCTEAYDAIQKAGYDYVVYYQNRQPVKLML